MNKIIVAILAAFMLSFAGTAAHAAYEPTTETDVKPEPKDGKVEEGEKERIVVKTRVQGDSAQCTGFVVAIFKGGKEVLKEREKPSAKRVAFNGIVPEGTTKIIFLYERGSKDPCDKSKSNIKL